jgi:hypothetical protein
MPVARRDYERVRADRVLDPRVENPDDPIPLGNAQGAPGAEVSLDVDRE